MRWEEAIQKSVEELSESRPEWSVVFLALLMRAGQLTTDTSNCDKCGSGG